MQKKCSVEGCNEPHRAKGYCMCHYNMWRRNGKPEPKKTKQTGCKVKGCDDEHFAKGYCHRHYEQIRVHGEILDSERERGPKKDRIQACSVDGCNRQHYANGYCLMHNARFERCGTTDLPEKDYINKNNICIMTGCDKEAYCKEYCKDHYYRNNRKLAYEKLIEEVKCVRCGKLLNDDNRKNKTTCNQCYDKSKEQVKIKEARRIRNNQCVLCGEPATVMHNHENKSLKGRIRPYCEMHYFKYVANRYGGVKNWTILKELWHEQEGICPYTGEKLILGKNTVVDHIISKYDGGKNIKENLQWVGDGANIAKGKMPHEEFIALCRRIVEYDDQKGSVEQEEHFSDWTEDYTAYEAYP